jgi:hypothetical protein
MRLKLFRQHIYVSKIHLEKINSRVGQIATTTGTTHTGPHIVATAYSLLHNEATNESTGSGYQYILHQLSSKLFVKSTQLSDAREAEHSELAEPYSFSSRKDSR